MDKQRGYITLNRSRDFKRALLFNLRVNDNAVYYTKQEKQQWDSYVPGCYMAHSIDGGSAGFYWSRFICEIVNLDQCVFHLYAYASDEKTIIVDGGVVEFDQYLKNEDIPIHTKQTKLAGFYTSILSNAADGLLNLSGRYLWIKIEMVTAEPQKIVLKKIKLLVMGERITDYLPEIYNPYRPEQEFFNRFISIFESIFYDIEESIGQLGNLLDYSRASGSLLHFLASFVGVSDTENLQDEDLRLALEVMAKSAPYTGTKRCVEETVQQVFGVRPNIIEHFEISKMLVNGKDKALYKHLFGENPYKFFIMLPEKAAAGFLEKTQSAAEKIKKVIPAHTDFEIILLKPYAVLGMHCYLGVNTCVSEYHRAVLDYGSAISYDTYLGGW